jgi:hypothetical protein
MDGDAFDRVTRQFERSAWRRGLGTLSLAASAALGNRFAPEAAGKRKRRRCRTADCPLFEVCRKGRCSCNGGPSAHPATCCANGAGSFCVDLTFPNLTDPFTCAMTGGCQNGDTPCSGTACQVCCPRGTACQPEGWCKGQLDPN